MEASFLRVSVEVAGAAIADAVVMRFRVEERASEVGRVVVSLASEEPIAAQPMLGRPAALRIERLGGDRSFHGVVWSCRTSPPRHDQSEWHVELEIRPRLGLLALGRTSRTFQQVTTRDVVSRVLASRGLTADDTTWALIDRYPPRPWVVQHGESDLELVTRLLAADGIAYAIEHEGGSDRVLLFDAPPATPIEGASELRDRDATRLDHDVVYDVEQTLAARPDEVALRDYDFQHPRLDLTVRERTPGSSRAEVYDHPGGYVEIADGRRRARRLLERLRTDAHVVCGWSDCVRLAPGRSFTIQGHPRAALDATYLVTSVVHEGEPCASADPESTPYRCRFEAVPAGVAPRPRDVPPKPVVGGVHLAFATTPAGEEIHCDPHGRATARFVWDRDAPRDDGSSAPMRVGQLGLGGSMTLPRGGFEIVTTFELGDLDRPFVAGHLYNAEAPPPYELPAGKTRTAFRTDTTEGGGGVNEIRFEDAAGHEEMLFCASRDLTVRVENDQVTSVARDETVTVGGTSRVTVGTVLTTTVGDSRSLLCRSSQRIDVGKDLSMAVGGVLGVTVRGTRKVTVGGDWLETTKGTFDRSVSDAQVITTVAGYGRSVVGSSSITVLGAWAEACGKSRSVEAKNLFETVVGAKVVKAQSVSVGCGAGCAETATRENVTCKGNRNDSAGAALGVTGKKSVSARADSVTVTAEDDLRLVAGKVEISLKKDGSIRVKGKKLDLRQVKNIHGEHRSN